MTREGVCSSEIVLVAVSSMATAYGALPAAAPHRSTLQTPLQLSNAPVQWARLYSRRSRPECYADFPTRDYVPYTPIVIPDVPGCDTTPPFRSFVPK